MRAAFYEGVRTITVRQTRVPEPGPGEVRLRVTFCGICGSDLSLYKTGVLAGPDVILGHEVSAAVDLDPAGTFDPGTRVTTNAPVLSTMGSSQDVTKPVTGSIIQSVMWSR